MKTGKTNFIHSRPRQANNDKLYEAKGGLTVAWRLNPENDSLEIAKPAHCNPTDLYVKRVGRDLAASRFDGVLVVTREQYVGMAINNLNHVMQLTNQLVSPNQTKEYAATMRAAIETEPADTLNATWFEGLVMHIIARHLEAEQAAREMKTMQREIAKGRGQRQFSGADLLKQILGAGAASN